MVKIGILTKNYHSDSVCIKKVVHAPTLKFFVIRVSLKKKLKFLEYFKVLVRGWGRG